MQSVDDSLQREMYIATIEQLVKVGFQHYEVSNFAKPGYRCQHNEVYWTGGEYFAVGPGAARYVDGVRSTNHRSTVTYLNRVLSGKSPIAECEQLDAESKAREQLVFGLRRIEGVPIQEFENATGCKIEDLCGEAVDRFVDRRLLTIENGTLRLTGEGLLISDSLWPELL